MGWPYSNPGSHSVHFMSSHHTFYTINVLALFNNISPNNIVLCAIWSAVSTRLKPNQPINTIFLSPIIGGTRPSWEFLSYVYTLKRGTTNRATNAVVTVHVRKKWSRFWCCACLDYQEVKIHFYTFKILLYIYKFKL